MYATIDVRKFLGIFLVVLGILSRAQAQYSGGSGTPDDRYGIATAADLIALGETPDDYNKHFLLTADIDLDPSLPGNKIFHKALIAPDTNNVSTWFEGPRFAGSFDGNGHTISHLTIRGRGRHYLGLFGALHSKARVRDLTLEAADVEGTYDSVGALVGVNSGHITACSSTGRVSGRYYVGGFVGGNGGSISDCRSVATVDGDRPVGGLAGSNRGEIARSHSSGTIRGSNHIGGLVGTNWEGSITTSASAGMVNGRYAVGGLVGSNWRGNIASSHSTVSVIGESDVGGLAGYNFDGTITASHSTGTVDGDWFVGGLAGLNGATITMSYATGMVTGNERVGGLVGHNGMGDFVDAQLTASLTDCHSTGVVHGDRRVGGLAGMNCAVITTSYASGTVTGNESVGGLVGRNGMGDYFEPEQYGSVTDCHSAGTITGNGNVGGLVGENYWGRITTCYSIGSVTGTENVGGLVGQASGEEPLAWITASFWDPVRSGQRTSNGGTKCRTTRMQTAGTFLDAGWDFINEATNGTDDIWWIDEGRDYPRLWWELPEAGIGDSTIEERLP